MADANADMRGIAPVVDAAPMPVEITTPTTHVGICGSIYMDPQQPSGSASELRWAMLACGLDPVGIIDTQDPLRLLMMECYGASVGCVYIRGASDSAHPRWASPENPCCSISAVPSLLSMFQKVGLEGMFGLAGTENAGMSQGHLTRVMTEADGLIMESCLRQRVLSYRSLQQIVYNSLRGVDRRFWPAIMSNHATHHGMLNNNNGFEVVMLDGLVTQEGVEWLLGVDSDAIIVYIGNAVPDMIGDETHLTLDLLRSCVPGRNLVSLDRLKSSFADLANTVRRSRNKMK